jgi:enamine deaminase RidA (YjgF/YER057c/UK114 family)
VRRTAINPWPWSVAFGFDQAQLIEQPSRQLVVSGQAAVNGEGVPQHAGDMTAQVTLALDNLETVLAAADMTFADVVRLVVYTTDVETLRESFGGLTERVGGSGARPSATLVGVTQLAYPELMVELEATAFA